MNVSHVQTRISTYIAYQIKSKYKNCIIYASWVPSAGVYKMESNQNNTDIGIINEIYCGKIYILLHFDHKYTLIHYGLSTIITLYI